MRKLLWATFCVALISMVFAGCEKEPTYTVKVTATKGGTVEWQNREYKEGETVVVTAIPADGYYFNEWSDGSPENPRTITISNKDVRIKAEFAKSPLLTISTSGNGKIETDVNGSYAPGSSVTVTANPDVDYYFIGWSDGNTKNPRTINVDREDISLTAYFFAQTVDLGLESGTLWATRNLGANAPQDYGDYYAWGETEPKNNYIWETYKYCKGSKETLTKYSNNAECGFNGYTDNLTTLLPEDDAATVVLGSDYSMPTAADWVELYNQCYWDYTSDYTEWDRYNKTSGFIVYKSKSADDKGWCYPSASYSLSDPHIFLPVAGWRVDSSFYNYGVSGCYWSASLDEDDPQVARGYSYFERMNPSGTGSRCSGFSVRPVRRK